MSNKDEWRKILQAQLACLEEIDEEDIGSQVYVRDSLDDEWVGPYRLFRLVSPGENFIFEVDGHTWWKFATKTLPIEPQHLTLIPWHGGECPVKAGTQTILSFADGDNTMVNDPEDWGWGFATNITGYAPVIITIDIEEE